ncbi:MULTISPECIES: hypothetical protein [Phocaeicola]|mgnify:CR=1 FL=1|uniref:Uncharacterized protein n=1 Tax=Phocaeicola vulgatus TaxID=821 RepID=A0A7Y6U9G0_PHOVU|nr:MULTISPECIES: hypothetical protein [Phocaeicola]NVB73754.1 hypothetical protein [Phocaeicola vulgatus]
MAKTKENLNYLEELVAHLGHNGAAERLSTWVSDICKAAPASKEVDDVVNFLIHLKRDVLDGKMDV